MNITNPAFNYEQLDDTLYSSVRRADPRIARYIHDALGDAKTVANVGAGAGSYEPEDRYVTAVEPSANMRAQRMAYGKAPAINAVAEALPLDDNSFDATMATVTIHHWLDLEKGLAEMKRVAKKRVVILTFDPYALTNFWNYEYFPQLIEIERARYPEISRIIAVLEGKCDVVKVPVPNDCTDGFQDAFFGRPEAFLKKQVRQAQSAWGFLPPQLEAQYVERLANDLASGEWDKKYGYLRKEPLFYSSLRLIVAEQNI